MKEEVSAMKRLICFVAAVLLVLYGFCYIDKNGTDELPTTEEYTEYIIHKKDKAVEAYNSVKDWITASELFN